MFGDSFLKKVFSLKTLIFSQHLVLINFEMSSFCLRMSGRWMGRRIHLHRLDNCRSMSKSTIDLRGIFAAVTTPFDETENIAYDKLQANVTKWNSEVPFAGYLVQGSTGEVVSLSSTERVEMVRRMRQFIPQNTNKLVLAGPGCESTLETIKLACEMSDAGADALVVVTPSYYKGRLTSEALKNYYVKVADASPIPVILYSVPMNTSIDLDPDVVLQLSRHPNIIGVKDSGGDIAKISYIVHKTRSTGFQVLAGSAGFLMPALNAGCVGGILASANALGNEVCELYRLSSSGDNDNRSKARNLQGLLVAPNWAVTKKFGIPGLKQAMDWIGYYGGPTRMPLLSLNDTEKQALRMTLQDSGLM